MTWFLYRQGNRPLLSEYRLPDDPPMPGQVFIGEYEEKPDINGKVFINDELSPDMASVRAVLLMRAEQERQRRGQLPVMVDGAPFDANATARENVTGVINRIREHLDAGTTMDPAKLFWRGADDQMYGFTDMASYKQFLGKLLIAITSRGTDLYAWKWRKCAEIEAATTIDELKAIDFTN